jgi:deoxycytidylate deaminase
MDCHAVHAEMNAILRAGNLWLEKNPTLYVNGVTCLRCALTIANSGIKSVVMLVTEYEEKRDPAATQQLCEQYGVEVRLAEWD